MYKTNVRKSYNLVKSHELISHFIRGYLVPQLPYSLYRILTCNHLVLHSIHCYNPCRQLERKYKNVSFYKRNNERFWKILTNITLSSSPAIVTDAFKGVVTVTVFATRHRNTLITSHSLPTNFASTPEIKLLQVILF